MRVGYNHFDRVIWVLFAAWMGSLFAVVRADDVDLVIGTDRPLRLRVSLQAGNLKWTDHFRQLENRYHDLVFDRLDANGDGRLTKPEAQRAPAPVFRPEGSLAANINETHVAFNFLVLDDDGDGHVSREELKAYYADYGSGPISMGLLNLPGLGEGRTLALFRQLDQNGDAFLEAGELEAAAKLWRFDRDANELLSLEELQPAIADSKSGEFTPYAIPYPLDAAVNYAIRFERVQENTPPATRHLKYRLSRDGSSPFEGLAFPSTAQDTNRAVIRREGFQVEFSVRPPSLRILNQIRRVLRREVAGLPGEKKITDEVTFPEYLRGHAALIDANADGRLTEEELESYLAKLLPARIAAEGGRIVFRASPTVTGLFAALDWDHDGQLSKQELSRLAKVVSERDENADGKLSLTEIPLIVRILMERETAPPPYLLAEQRNAGPPWFYRLDKNQDGTLTRSEFPGERELFEQLDQDHDQILSLEEALAADEKFRRVSKQEN